MSSSSSGRTSSAQPPLAGTFPLLPPVPVSMCRTPSGYAPLIWSAHECVRLRGEGGVAISPIGMCPDKIATNAKAAAVPATLADEELYLCARLGWLSCTDSSSGAPVDPFTVLNDNLAKATSSGQRTRMLLRRTAFADLWSLGYRLTSGLKFGVDYLAYRSDPSVCHAAFMVRIIPEGSEITPLDLVARARVATTTLKTAVLAYVDLPTATVRYEAFKRMGPGQAVFVAASALAVPLPIQPPPAASAALVDTASGNTRQETAITEGVPSSDSSVPQASGVGTSLPSEPLELADPAAEDGASESLSKRQKLE